MKVVVDDAACVGHGRCYALAPDVFEDDDRGHCRVIRAQVSEGHEEQARRAEANCPESAIRIED